MNNILAIGYPEHTLENMFNMGTDGFDIITCTPDTIALAAPIALRTGKIFVYPEKVHYPNIHQVDSGIGEYSEAYNDVEMQLRRGYDKVVNGKKVLLIEDIITTGKSVMETIECVHRSGGLVVEIRCIWNRGGSTGITPELVNQWCNTDDAQFIPILSIINDPVESWEPDECPLCDESLVCGMCNGSGAVEINGDKLECGQCGGEGIDHFPLTDPKTGEVI